jgi:hypothetical protein
MMANSVRDAFLRAQLDAGLALAGASDILELTPLEGMPPDRYIADFRCRSLIHNGSAVLLADRFLVGIHFPENYLRVFQPERVITILAPHNIWLPNVRGPFLCPGHMLAGTPLVDILFQVFEVLTAQRMTLDERHALHPAVCAWARDNGHMFPTDRRPLRRRADGGAAQPVAPATVT